MENTSDILPDYAEEDLSISSGCRRGPEKTSDDHPRTPTKEDVPEASTSRASDMSPRAEDGEAPTPRKPRTVKEQGVTRTRYGRISRPPDRYTPGGN